MTSDAPISNIFQNPLALALGILVGMTLDNQLEDPNALRKLTTSDTLGWLGTSSGINQFGTGRGGWHYDLCGDKGKIPLTDQHAGGSDGVPGEGGTLTRGGFGLFKGSRHDGGGFTSSFAANHFGTCAGAGAGFHGGGAGFTRGGSGGGSSLTPASKPWRDNPAYYDAKNEPEEIKEVVHYDKDTLVYDTNGYSSEDLVENLEGLINLNCPFTSYYDHVCGYMKGYKDYKQMLDIFSTAQGHGFIIVSKKNRHIHWKHLRVPVVGAELKWKWLGYGALKNIGHIFYEKDGSIQSFTLEPGKYEVLLYGAMGGSKGIWTPMDDSLCGGFGGMQLCTIEIQKNPVTLYAYIGQRGTCTSKKEAFNGGGAPGPGCTGGGGCTDIRYYRAETDDESTGDNYDRLFKIMVVAGGGGGIWGLTSGTSYGSTKSSVFSACPLVATPENPQTLFSKQYPVNDKTKVLVDFDVQVSPEIEAPVDLHIRIKLADGNEGELEEIFTIGSSGHVGVEYLLDKVYEKDTPTHKVTIEAEYWVSEHNTNNATDELIAATSKILIRVETVTNNEGNLDTLPSTPLYINAHDEICLVDEVGFTGKRYTNKQLEIEEFIDLFDEVTSESSSATPLDGVEVEDLVNLVDSVLLEMHRVYDINVEVESDVSGDFVDGAGRYEVGDIVSLVAVYSGEATVEWYENDSLIHTGDTYEFEVTSPRNLVAKFIYETPEDNPELSDLPFVVEGCIARFDAILNYNGEHVDNHLWTVIGRKATVSTDSMGFSDDAYIARFDAINNTKLGHDTGSMTWEDIHE